MSRKHQAGSPADNASTTMAAEQRLRVQTTRIDGASPAEVQAVQVHRPVIVQTRQGETLARVGEWLVTDPDGSVRVLSDQKFRMKTLHQQLAQLLTRSRGRVNKAS